MQLPAAQQSHGLVGALGGHCMWLCLAWLGAVCDFVADRACCVDPCQSPTMQTLTHAHPPAAGSRLGTSTADFDSANFQQRLTVSPSMSRSASLAVASQDGALYSQQPAAKLHLAQVSSLQLMNTQVPTDLQGLQVKCCCSGLLPVACCLSRHTTSMTGAPLSCPQSGRR